MKTKLATGGRLQNTDPVFGQKKEPGDLLPNALIQTAAVHPWRDQRQ